MSPLCSGLGSITCKSHGVNENSNRMKLFLPFFLHRQPAALWLCHESAWGRAEAPSSLLRTAGWGPATSKSPPASTFVAPVALALFSSLDHCYCFPLRISFLRPPSGEPRHWARGQNSARHNPTFTLSAVVSLSTPIRPATSHHLEEGNASTPVTQMSAFLPRVCLSIVTLNQPAP